MGRFVCVCGGGVAGWGGGWGWVRVCVWVCGWVLRWRGGGRAGGRGTVGLDGADEGVLGVGALEVDQARVVAVAEGAAREEAPAAGAAHGAADGAVELGAVAVVGVLGAVGVAHAVGARRARPQRGVVLVKLGVEAVRDVPARAAGRGA